MRSSFVDAGWAEFWHRTGSGSEENGVVHIHAGVHGIGGIPGEDFDWHNPVAQIKIRRK